MFYLFKEKQDLSTICLSQSIFLNLHTASVYKQVMVFPLLRLIDIAEGQPGLKGEFKAKLGNAVRP